ncbi:UNVERIFIED_CONTAM: cytochrome and DOMON domain-containing protein [Sesamum calycinum]|uniref:Cytochrome and DOMON domain-containing protein n=1 Tax=Sesamum calycinum TaxID=2727403 RepID=A0AAW2NG44_9LAMI
MIFHRQQAIDVLSGATAKTHSNIMPLKTLHGAINAISWGLLLPIGAITARYLRQIQSIGPAWFYAHAGVQIFAVFLGTVGFSIGIKLGELSPGKVYGLHRKLGFAAFCLGWLQTLALLFRPKTNEQVQKYWKSYHHFVGYACVVLGVVNCFQGFEVMGESNSYAKLAYCLCLSTLVGFCIALEVNSWVIFCRKAKEEKLKREGVLGGGFEKGSCSSSRG